MDVGLTPPCLCFCGQGYVFGEEMKVDHQPTADESKIRNLFKYDKAKSRFVVGQIMTSGKADILANQTCLPTTNHSSPNRNRVVPWLAQKKAFDTRSGFVVELLRKCHQFVRKQTKLVVAVVVVMTW